MPRGANPRMTALPHMMVSTKWRLREGSAGSPICRGLWAGRPVRECQSRGPEQVGPYASRAGVSRPCEEQSIDEPPRLVGRSARPMQRRYARLPGRPSLQGVRVGSFRSQGGR